MTKHFNYPAQLTRQEEGGYLVTFPDLPEALSQGDDMASALHEAVDCLEEAIANRIAMKLPIPTPSKAKQDQHIIHSSRRITVAKRVV